MSVGNIKFTTFDLGGHSQARKVWKDYFPAVDAIVFLVDACDKSRIMESKSELDSLLLDESLSNCPVLVLGNKIDRPGALGEPELRAYFALNQTTGKVCKPFVLLLMLKFFQVMLVLHIFILKKLQKCHGVLIFFFKYIKTVMC